MSKSSKYTTMQISKGIHKDLTRLKMALEEIAGKSLSYTQVLKLLIQVKVDWSSLLEIHEILTDTQKDEKNDIARSDRGLEEN